MTHTFEIKVQCKGHAVGTLGWVNSIFANGELIIKSCRDGAPGLFFHMLYDKHGKQNDQNQGNYFICKVAQAKDEPEYEYGTYNEVFLKCVNVVGNAYQQGFLDYPLTPAAYTAVSDFLNSACEHFANWWKQH